jgi:RNA polymerase sigma-70 factor, ECF subfamily
MPIDHPGEETWKAFATYLRFLVDQLVSNQNDMQAKMDPSGIVQQTLMEAHLASKNSGVTITLAWLRKSLSNNLADEFRRQYGGKRDVRREHRIAECFDQSSIRLESLVRDYGPTPDQVVEAQERTMALLVALGQLPESQRQAITLQLWDNKSLQEIAELTGKSRLAVAGLLKRGLQTLREHLRGRSEF